MSDDPAARLRRWYRSAIDDGNYGLADLIACVLEVMGGWSTSRRDDTD